MTRNLGEYGPIVLAPAVGIIYYHGFILIFLYDSPAEEFRLGTLSG